MPYECVDYLALLVNNAPLLFVHLLKRHHYRLEHLYVVSVFISSNQLSDVLNELPNVLCRAHHHDLFVLWVVVEERRHQPLGQNWTFKQSL